VQRVQRPVKTGIFYGWVIVLVSFVTLTLVMGSRFTFGVFYPSILQDTGWSRAATAGIFSMSMLVYALVALGVGAAFDRLGPRRLFPLAALLLGAGYFLCSQITTLWQFYVYYGVIVGAGYTALGFIPHVSLISRWFVRRRGLASSLALAGMGVGSLIFAPVGEYLIAQYGWRHSYLLYAGLIPGVLIPLILMFYRSDPASLGLQPDGDAASQRARHTTPLASLPGREAPYTAALRTRAFWALFLVIFTIAFNTMTLLVHQNQYLVDSGFSQEFAAWMLGLSGILRSAGSVIWGSISDRTTREGSFTISAVLGLIAMPCLMSVQAAPEAWRVVLFVLLIGIGYGGTSVLYGTAAADLFQGRHFGKILGILDMGFGLGAALGSYLAGVLFDRYQTYHISFYVVIGFILVSILGMWWAAPRIARVKAGTLASSATEP
jgi:MFS family permease